MPLPGATEVERAARAALAAGDYSAAARPLEDYLGRYPERYDLRCLLGFVHQHFGMLEAARRCYEEASLLAPASVELSHNLGQVCFALDDLTAARACFEQALILAPDSLDVLDARATMMQADGDIVGALACYERILSLDPQYPRAYVGMAEAFFERGWCEDAEKSLRTALSFEPDNVPALNALAVVQMHGGRYQAALALLDRLIALRPKESGLLRNKALVHAALGEHAAAEASCRQALRFSPDDPDVHFTLGCSYLMTGRLLEGWNEHEYRWASQERGQAVKAPLSKLPRWRGEGVDPVHSALILYAEQGFGDNIQFARYVARAAQRFSRLCLVTRPSLLTLFQRSFDALAEVVAEAPDECGYTHHCPLMSLPLAFATTLDSIPTDIPYLRSDPQRVAAWRRRLDAVAGMKVGVAWVTGKRGAHKKSFELDPSLLAPLFALDDLRWVSLNKESLTAGQQDGLSAAGVIDWTGELQDFDDTAALIDALDLVVTVDTAVAHLAGALGHPVWLLNRAESEWRWMLARSDSPWYPTLRIFRQRVTQQWAGVIDEVRAALAAEGRGER